MHIKTKRTLSAAMLLMAALAFVAFNVDSLLAGTHTRGALVCSDCHTMHYSLDGAAAGNWGVAGPYNKLLIDDSSGNDICLACHDDNAADTSGAPNIYGVNAADETFYPGGDFVGLSADGNEGHFKDTGSLVVDDTPADAPGGEGVVASADLRCWSCHDPHNSSANAGDFRLLRKKPLIDAPNGTDYGGADIVVVASAAALGAADEAGTNHTVYRSGISEWCGACHSNADNDGTGFHGTSAADSDTGAAGVFQRHPTENTFPAGYVTEYNAADAGTPASWEVPFEDITGWATNTLSHDVAATDKVMCLSCHRAHVGRTPGGTATYYRDGLRWDPAVGLDSDSGCNKCHNK